MVDVYISILRYNLLEDTNLRSIILIDFDSNSAMISSGTCIAVGSTYCVSSHLGKRVELLLMLRLLGLLYGLKRASNGRAFGFKLLAMILIFISAVAPVKNLFFVCVCFFKVLKNET